MQNFGRRRHKLKESTTEYESDCQAKSDYAMQSEKYEPWTVSTITAFKLLISARLCAGLWSIVSDCDEVYNYWEPAHYLLYGYGFQTWEYSPVYAIRSYAYIIIHVLPLRIFQFLIPDNKILQFYFLRCVLGIVCAGCEVFLYRSVTVRLGSNVGRLMFWFQLMSTGMFVSSTAFLPSSFSMYLVMIATGSWLAGEYRISILATAASALVGWPFAVVLGIPIAVDIVLLQKKYFAFFVWSCIALFIFLVPIIMIDTFYFGKLVVTPYNILVYNVFTSHGPDLYGVEPVSFYIKNGFLNFNVAFFLALLSLPVSVLVDVVIASRRKYMTCFLMAPMYIWLLIFFFQPHKEERFLFPVYPFFTMGAALCLDRLQGIWSHFVSDTSRSKCTHASCMCSAIVVAFYSLLCLSRSVSLYQGYHASMDVFVVLRNVSTNAKVHSLPHDRNVNICVGKDWHRFPSNFFLPSDRWNLQFIESEFKGLLPKPYDPVRGGTRTIPSHMNDRNCEERSRYVDVRQCHYLIDMDRPGGSVVEPRYTQSGKWTVVASGHLLDTTRSHWLMRAFYIPFLSHKYRSYADYNILKATRTKRSVKLNVA